MSKNYSRLLISLTLLSYNTVLVQDIWSLTYLQYTGLFVCVCACVCVNGGILLYPVTIIVFILYSSYLCHVVPRRIQVTCIDQHKSAKMIVKLRAFCLFLIYPINSLKYLQIFTHCNVLFYNKWLLTRKVLWKKDAYFTIHEFKHSMIFYAEMQLKPIVLRGAIIVIITFVFK